MNKTNDGLLDFDHLASDQGKASAVSNHSSLERLRKQNAAVKELERLTLAAESDDDLLLLRNKVVETDYDDLDKEALLMELDNYVINKMAPIIKEASLLEEKKQDKKNLYLGAAGFVVIGFIASSFFPKALLISIVLAVLALIGNAGGKECRDSEDAARTIERFRKAGYPIKY